MLSSFEVAKPFTRRGVLSSINSLFDPLGLTAPVTIAGKSLLREAMTGNHDWDAPLPSDYETMNVNSNILLNFVELADTPFQVPNS
jgi:hypothetical protein